MTVSLLLCSRVCARLTVQSLIRSLNKCFKINKQTLSGWWEYSHVSEQGVSESKAEGLVRGSPKALHTGTWPQGGRWRRTSGRKVLPGRHACRPRNSSDALRCDTLGTLGWRNHTGDLDVGPLHMAAVEAGPNWKASCK